VVLLLTEWQEFRDLDPEETWPPGPQPTHPRRPQRPGPRSLARRRLDLPDPPDAAPGPLRSSADRSSDAVPARARTGRRSRPGGRHAGHAAPPPGAPGRSPRATPARPARSPHGARSRPAGPPGPPSGPPRRPSRRDGQGPPKGARGTSARPAPVRRAAVGAAAASWPSSWCWSRCSWPTRSRWAGPPGATSARSPLDDRRGTPGTTFLLVGSDSRAESTDEEGRAATDTTGSRTDTILLLHTPSGGGPTVMVSLPRDSYVEVPGRGMNKLNASYAFGGPSCSSTRSRADGPGGRRLRRDRVRWLLVGRRRARRRRGGPAGADRGLRSPTSTCPPDRR
jgi:hypothetical protein